MGGSWLIPNRPEEHAPLLVEMGGRWSVQCSCGWEGSPSQATQEEVEAEFALHLDLARLPTAQR